MQNKINQMRKGLFGPTIDDEVKTLLKHLDKMDPTTDEYAAIVKQIETLMKSKSYMKGDNEVKKALISGAASLATVYMVLHYEELGIITTKALQFIPKIKP